MPFKRLLMIGAGLLLLLAACSDLFETSIEKEQITVNTPLPDARSTSYTTTFWWQEVASVLTYHLQIVSPRFDSTITLRLDTTIKKNKFTISLNPGQYQWRIRAQNGSSKTAYFTYNLRVDTADLAAQVIVLSLPEDEDYALTADVVFRWQALFGTKKYRLQVDTASFANEASLVLNRTTTNLSYTFSLPKERDYQWRVRGEKEAVYSQWSEARTVTFDNSPPDSVGLSSPANNAIDQPIPVTLKWVASKAAAKYKVYLYKTTATNLVSTISTTTNTYGYSGTKGDVIFWQVKAIDAAGNESIFSKQWKFTLKP